MLLLLLLEEEKEEADEEVEAKKKLVDAKEREWEELLGGVDSSPLPVRYAIHIQCVSYREVL